MIEFARLLAAEIGGFVPPPALQGLKMVGPLQGEAIRALVATLGDMEEEIRRDAMALLQRAGTAAAPAPIMALAGSDRTIIRAGAAEILGRVRPITVEVISAVSAALRDPASEVVRAAGVALKGIESQSTRFTRSRVRQLCRFGSLNSDSSAV